MEESLQALFISAPFLVSFVAGILTFISPCVLPLIPAYISYISGLSIKQLSSEEHLGWSIRIRIMYAALLFVLGFSIVFVLLGAAMANIVSDVFAYEWISWVAGGIIVLFGMHMAGFITIKFLNFEQRASFGNVRSKAWFSPFILGFSFALGWTPCIGPIFAAIVSIGAKDPSNAISLMAIYAAGLALPFLATALLTTYMLGFLNRIKQYFRIIEIVAGLLLIVVGLAIATGGLGQLAALFS